ncbi:hypothetical protein [Stakelama marina]|uniref:Uncharacterized protein n=1 Tax=Stakelama marina TaxID=2826939 RepID=A0A8T4IG60_9SPHN|nr:hypothetical protein [Stakelama marina]MBR0553587.1 hypothetical protein [Stakelama marina]
MTDQHEYWAKRVQQERDSADRASDAAVRRIHIELAERYSALMGEESVRVAIPARN